MPKSTLESDIEKATSEFNVQEDWQLIIDLCDRIKAAPNGSKESLKYTMKRLNHPVPHVAMQALTLLSACVNNCGKPFHLEICSRDWTNNARNLIIQGHEKISQRIRELIEKWASDFKEDPQLHLMVQFHKKLVNEGFSFDFQKESTDPRSSTTKTAKKQEDDLSFREDMDLAIAMSLIDADSTKTPSSAGSLYPAVTTSAPVAYQEEREVCKVRALYDFEAAEDNEMTFQVGEVFSVLDNSDENWWKGRNNRGVGLFPANFVTTDLTEPKTEKKKVRFADTQSAVEKPKVTKPKVVISAEQLDLTLSMLKNASPNEIDDEEETICAMEESCVEMGTLLEKKVLECDRRKDDLSDLNEKFLQALTSYQQLMKEPVNVAPPQPVYQPAIQTSQPYQNQQMNPYHQYQQYANITPGYTPQVAQQEQSYLYANPAALHQQPSSLPPQAAVHHQHYSNQPSSLPPMPVASQQPTSYGPLPTSQAVISSQSYAQQQQLPPQNTSLTYDNSQVAYNQQEQYSTGQYYGTETLQYAPNDYTAYSYGVAQNPQTYQQTQVYQ